MRISRLPNLSVQTHAQEFHKAVMFLCDEPIHNAVVIVNAAFALELYLKCLNTDLVFSNPSELEAEVYLYGKVYDDPNKKGHSLTPLFASLSLEIKDHINTRYACSSLISMVPTFTEALALYDNVYVEWRYLFEGKAKTVDVSFMLELLDFTAGVTNEFRNEKDDA